MHRTHDDAIGKAQRADDSGLQGAFEQRSYSESGGAVSE
jgi:hypothetical protein